MQLGSKIALVDSVDLSLFAFRVGVHDHPREGKPGVRNARPFLRIVDDAKHAEMQLSSLLREGNEVPLAEPKQIRLHC